MTTPTLDVPILGEDATPDQVRRFLKKVDLRKCKRGGRWISPITGQEFDTYQALCGHVGALSRDREADLTPLTEDRKGYVKAVRRGIEPTPAQREAHRDYMRMLRKKRRLEEGRPDL